ncbi:MAG: uracil-DNA glycosylase [Candidatus Cloacimonetes bacterium]|nr:uracil-DNA glycosylase [Candidatus Cloacimonadota bacterium]MDX9949479.1 uracil-DNA glycosylase [Candidatus Syntrophosphaera sp.]NLN85496.1 uracil-DNA glycosylase [Candidatus Cloacimonadota bacterium]
MRTTKTEKRRPARVARQHLEMMENLGIKHIFMPQEPASQNLQSLAQLCANCQKCDLAQSRNKSVFGEGNSRARIMIIGEAPGAEEDKQGRPFVGEAGKLLDKMLAAIDIERSETYICNILKCRPPKNRDPQASERQACLPHLIQQIQIIQPKIILILGLVAAQTLLETNQSLGQLRQNTQLLFDIPTHVTYHPAALLRNPNWKRPAWEDLKIFRDHLLDMS